VAGLVAPTAAIVVEVIYAAILGRHAVAGAITAAVIDAVGAVVIIAAVLPILRTVLPVLRTVLPILRVVLPVVRTVLPVLWTVRPAFRTRLLRTRRILRIWRLVGNVVLSEADGAHESHAQHRARAQGGLEPALHRRSPRNVRKVPRAFYGLGTG